MNALAQGAIRQFTQWPMIEQPTIQLRVGHFTSELPPARRNVGALREGEGNGGTGAIT